MNSPNKKIGYIGLDLSGTGTTAIFDGKNIVSFSAKNWFDHYNFIKNYLSKKRTSILFFEGLHKIQKQQKTNIDLVHLAYLIGALNIKYKYKLEVTSFMIKKIGKMIAGNKKNIPNLEYKAKRGFYYNKNKINQHELDAIIIYFYGRAKINKKYWL
ncbi:hypothetical protein [Spiroplasma endosymbiont of Aspidapion aeneum]|uniref:hypothetical protein n=1 Tax=Spiroplasma endosymbiont of Aspidapion aeneum TaxID=3066276 RepID=UPI00313D6691